MVISCAIYNNDELLTVLKTHIELLTVTYVKSNETEIDIVENLYFVTAVLQLGIRPKLLFCLFE